MSINTGTILRSRLDVSILTFIKFSQLKFSSLFVVSHEISLAIKNLLAIFGDCVTIMRRGEK